VCKLKKIEEYKTTPFNKFEIKILNKFILI